MTFSPTYIPRKVSVIIITYNYGHFITHAIQSVLAQNIADLEIIVVDDGSTDQTRFVVESFSNRYPVKYVYQKNTGQSAARNTGLANSSGEFIQFLDADDILGPGKINNQLEYFDSHLQASIAVCPNRRFRKTSGGGRPIAAGTWHLFDDFLDVHLCYFNIAPPHAFLYRREVITDTGLFDSATDNCEDYDLLLRAAVKGYIPSHTASCMVYYRRHPKSITANSMRQYLTDASMHARLENLLNRHPTFPRGRRLEGLIAFAAGAVKTSVRLCPHHPAQSHDLFDAAFRQMKTAKELALNEKHTWNFSLQLYSLRLLCLLTPGLCRQVAIAGKIRSELIQVLEFVQLPMTPSGLAIDGMRSVVNRNHGRISDRFFLAYHACRFFINRLIPGHCRSPWITETQQG